jgi:dTDP-glucose 4,6-dehydratase
MTTVLVTGALGVIGQHLTRSLKESGYDVIGADLGIRDYSDYVRADVTAFEDLHRIGKLRKVDVVVHMAGEDGRMVGETHPQRMVYVNDVGTVNVAQFCVETGARLISFSTSEVYGHLLDDDQPVTEDLLETRASAFATTNVYAMSKMFGEVLVKHFVENYALDAVTVRPFMVYGPGEIPSKWRSAMTNFVHAARHGEKLTVHSGTARAWCHVSDFVAGIQLLVERPPSTVFEAYNVGSDEYLEMEDVARTIVDVVGADPTLVEVVDPPSRFMSSRKRASIDKIRALGYEPKIDLRQGIASVAEWQEVHGY